MSPPYIMPPPSTMPPTPLTMHACGIGRGRGQGCGHGLGRVAAHPPDGQGGGRGVEAASQVPEATPAVPEAPPADQFTSPVALWVMPLYFVDSFGLRFCIAAYWIR